MLYLLKAFVSYLSSCSVRRFCHGGHVPTLEDMYQCWKTCHCIYVPILEDMSQCLCTNVWRHVTVSMYQCLKTCHCVHVLTFWGHLTVHIPMLEDTSLCYVYNMECKTSWSWKLLFLKNCNCNGSLYINKWSQIYYRLKWTTPNDGYFLYSLVITD